MAKKAYLRTVVVLKSEKGPWESAKMKSKILAGARCGSSVGEALSRPFESIRRHKLTNTFGEVGILRMSALRLYLQKYKLNWFPLASSSHHWTSWSLRFL